MQQLLQDGRGRMSSTYLPIGIYALTFKNQALIRSAKYIISPVVYLRIPTNASL